MRLQASTIEEFFVAADERESELRELDSVIRHEASSLQPELTKGMIGVMLGYGMMPYQTKSMKESGRWPLVALAPQKNYISLYICDVVDGTYVAEIYEERLGKVDCGKSCIRFKHVSDLNLEVLREMLRYVNQRFENGVVNFGV